MKKYLYLLITSGYFITGLKAQSVAGEIKDLSINPDGSIWLASNSGIIYWTKNLQDDFGTILKLPDPKPDYFGDKHINIEKVVFFNKDTFFVCGYVGKDLVGEDQGTPNMIYLTMDGGTTWQMKEFNNKGNWIYDALAQKNGKAWMGGSDGDIYYTENYGKDWKKLSSPFDDRTRLACLDKDLKNAVVGSLMGNELKISHDDFDKFQSLKTPFDQKAYSNTKTKDGSYSENQFFRIKIINDSLIVVDQQHHVFYSTLHNIQWQKFDQPLVGFCYDEKGNNLIGLTADNKIVSYNSKMTFEKELLTLSKDEGIIDLKSEAGSLYIMTAKYAAPKKGDDVIGTIGKMQVTRVGYKKISAYIIYKITGGDIAKIELEAH